MVKSNKRATLRLRESLLKDDLMEALCILIAQQRNFIVYSESKHYPLKLTGQMRDQVYL